MVLLSNDIMLYKFFMNKFRKIIDDMTKELHEMLRQSMMDKVYNVYAPQWYNRQMDDGGLLGAWDRKTTTSGHIIESSIKANKDKLTYDPVEFIHGSYYQSGGDWITTEATEGLFDIIVKGLAGSLFGEGIWRSKRDFWLPIWKKVEGNWIDKRFQQGMKSEGIQYRKNR